jgi:hypothetical protein
MTIAFVTSSFANGSASTSTTVNAPASIVAGNILVAIACTASPSGSSFALTGFTVQGTPPTDSTTTILTKVATGSEPASYTLSNTSQQHNSCVILQFSGASTLDGSAAYNENGAGATACTAPSQTPTVTGDCLIAVFVSLNNKTFTTPTGMTATTPRSGDFTSTYPFYQVLASTSATGSISSTQSVSSWYVGSTLLLAGAAPPYLPPGPRSNVAMHRAANW